MSLLSTGRRDRFTPRIAPYAADATVVLRPSLKRSKDRDTVDDMNPALP